VVVGGTDRHCKSLGTKADDILAVNGSEGSLRRLRQDIEVYAAERIATGFGMRGCAHAQSHAQGGASALTFLRDTT
jgi:hypothetical protein